MNAWAWFWAFVEGVVYWSVGALVAAFFGASSTVVGFVLVVLVLLILAVLQSMRLPRYARAEIDAIASDREAAARHTSGPDSMHYKIGSSIVIKTENAAKPEKQASSYLKELLAKLPVVDSSFDYGCGKLRYLDAILEKTSTLSLVDSEIQLSRIQKLKDSETSIRTLLKRSNRISIYNDEQFTELNAKYDRGFCINVLSVMPIIDRRRRALELIRSKLRPKGTCLFVVQYRNSDFTRMSKMSNARPGRDGFLIQSLRGYSFYGLISPETLTAMVKKAGFSVQQVSLNEGSAYLFAGRN